MQPDDRDPSFDTIDLRNVPVFRPSPNNPYIPEHVRKAYHSINKCKLDSLYLLEHDAFVKSLVDDIKDEKEKHGCKVLSGGVLLKMCSNEDMSEVNIGGEMNEYKRQIKICCNRTEGMPSLKQTLIHELIHAYDHCRFRNLRHPGCKFRACTEIRAYNMSGKCNTAVGLADFNGNKEECVKHWAAMSTIPYCDEPKETIEKVFEKCYHDYTPFNSEQYKQYFK